MKILNTRLIRKSSRKARKRSPVGSSPGTLSVDPNAPKSTIKVLSYSPEHYSEITSTDIDEVLAHTKRWPCNWVQVIGLGDADILQKLGAGFAIHRLTLEDISNLDQRPKFEPYGDRFFILAKMFDNTQEMRLSEQVSILLSGNSVLSFHAREANFFEPVKKRIRDAQGRIRYSGHDYLCYALLDCIVDYYFPCLDSCGERLNQIEDSMFSSSREQILSELHNLRHELLTMRRAIWPMRDVINSMLRETSPMFTAETKIHLRDCYDHVVQMIDLVEAFRELSASLIELSLSVMSHRLNEGIRILTVISTIFIPLNFIAGVYGMNFNTHKSPWNMPELNWFYGYPFALTLMLIVGFSLVYLFWKRGWLRGPKEKLEL